MRHAIAGAGCAVITPTRSPGLRAAAERLLQRVEAWRQRRETRARRPEAVDDATLRDLGLSHAALLEAGHPR